MTTSNKRIPPNRPDDWIYRRIEELESKVNRLENQAYPTVPVYSYDSLPQDAVEGQIAIIENAPDLFPEITPEPITTQIIAGAGLVGGGTLNVDRTIDVNPDGTTLEVASDILKVKTGGIGPTQLASTAVTPGTYGDDTHIVEIAVDADGRITSATEVEIASDPAGRWELVVWGSPPEAVTNVDETDLVYWLAE